MLILLSIVMQLLSIICLAVSWGWKYFVWMTVWNSILCSLMPNVHCKSSGKTMFSLLKWGEKATLQFYSLLLLSTSFSSSVQSSLVGDGTSCGILFFLLVGGSNLLIVTGLDLVFTSSWSYKSYCCCCTLGMDCCFPGSCRAPNVSALQ